MDQFYDRAGLDLFFDSRSHVGATTTDRGYLSYWMSQTGQIAGKLDDSVTMGCALEWVRSCHAARTPFFASINLQTSHFPYERPNGVEDPFQPSEIDFSVSLLEYPPDKLMTLQNAYYNALHYIDAQVHRLTTCLDELGLSERTVLLITGDHGDAFLENGVAGHAGIPLETTTKVGLLIHCPGRVEPALDDYPAQSIDIAPTILGLIGGPKCTLFQGIDVLHSGRPRADDRLIYIHCNNAMVSYDAVISGTGWKQIYDVRRKQATLHFRPTDLDEHENLIRMEPEVAEVLEGLRTKWRQRQILYYSRPRYYLWFCPPKAPEISAADRSRLIQAGREQEARQAVDRSGTGPSG
jgi:arylsulfatase A-like enzyme